MKKILLTGLLALGLVASLAGCSNQTSGTDTTPSAEVRTVTVAVITDDKPKTFVDENNNITGYDVEVLKAVDELLPEYEFKFEAMDQATMLLGVETGKYQLATDGLFKNPDREAKYLFPEENIGLSKVAFVIREDETEINSFADVVGKKLVPLPSNWGTYYITLNYNETHPDAQVKLETIDTLTMADAFRWVAEGRYDAFLTPPEPFADIQKELNLPVKLSDTVELVPTYPIFNKSETELAQKVSDALKQVKDNGTASELSREWLGEDIFAL